MGTKRKADKKETFTIRIRSSLILKLRDIENYNSKLDELIEKFLEEYYSKEE